MKASGVGASAGGLSPALGVARCGRSAGCVLCVLWAMSAAVLGGVDDLYTILPWSLLYGVRHTQEGSEAGRILRNGRAIVVQLCGQCGWGAGQERDDSLMHNGFEVNEYRVKARGGTL